METVKKTAANVAASAISGKEKTMATVQEKVDRIWAKDDFEKDLATERKDQRITEAELHKQMAQTHNLDEKEARTGTGIGTGTGTGTHSYSAKGVPGAGTGAHQMSAMPGHGTGQPASGHDVEGTAVGSHPIGKGTGTGTGTDSYSATGVPGAGTGAHQMSAMPGHGTGQPAGGHDVEGTAVGSHPIGKGTGTGTDSYSATGVPGAGTGAHQMSAMPGHGTGQPAGGHDVEGTAVGSHPIGKGTGTGTGTDSYSATGVPGTGTGDHQMSAMPGHGTGQPAGGHVVEGTAVGSHPIGKETGTGTRSTTAENRHVGGGT